MSRRFVHLHQIKLKNRTYYGAFIQLDYRFNWIELNLVSKCGEYTKLSLILGIPTSSHVTTSLCLINW